MDYTRPGRLSDRQEDDPEASRNKQAKLEQYINLVNLGLPLFEGHNARGMEGAGFGMYDVGAFL